MKYTRRPAKCRPAVGSEVTPRQQHLILQEGQWPVFCKYRLYRNKAARLASPGQSVQWKKDSSGLFYRSSSSVEVVSTLRTSCSSKSQGWCTHDLLTYFGFWIWNSLRVRIERFQLERSPSQEGENFGERSSMVATEHLMNTRRKAAKTSTAQLDNLTNSACCSQ